jgi:hypothetical protein
MSRKTTEQHQVLPEKLTVTQLVKKLPEPYGTVMFAIVQNSLSQVPIAGQVIAPCHHFRNKNY